MCQLLSENKENGRRSKFGRNLFDFHDIFFNAPIGIYTSTPEGRFLSANPAWAHMCGYDSPQELIENVFDIATQIYFDPDDRDTFKHLLEIHGEVVNHEYRLRRPDGSMLWVSENVRSVQDSQGQITYYQGFTTDITKRKKAEEAVVESEQRFAKAFKSSPAPQIISEIKTGTFIDVNDRWTEMIGYSKKEQVGRTSNQVGIWDDPQEREIIVQKLRNKGYLKEEPILFKTKQGQTRSALWSAEIIKLHGQELMLSMIFDVTERKQFEEELNRRSKAIEATMDGIALLSQQGIYTYLNQAQAKIHGYASPDELLGKNWRDLYERAELQRFDQEILPALTKKGQWRGEARGRKKDGSSFAQEVSLTVLENGLISVVRDITQRKAMENVLWEEEEKYRKLFDTSPDAIAIVDPNGTFLTINATMAARFGHTREELQNRRYDHVMPQETARYRVQKGNEAIEQGKLVFDEDERDGRHYQNYYVPLYFSGEKKAFQIISRDVTESKNLQKKLREMSFHDQLTGLYNRAYLDNELHRLNSSREYPITIMSMDLDGLKIINDTLGHEYGDLQLKACARIFQESFRGSDLVARSGGDEFVALLARTDLEDGKKIGARIWSKIQNYNEHHQDQPPLSLSLGLAWAENSAQDLHQVFTQADDRMYEDKMGKRFDVRTQILESHLLTLKKRDFSDHGHLRRVEDLGLQLGKKVKLSPSRLKDLALLAQVHDLGKVCIPSQILYKPGPLTKEEWEVIRRHPEKGYRIAQSTPALAGIADLILKHHEHWDGHGYPLGIAGDEIPIECRILAVVDAFEVMTSDRPHRKAMPQAQALEELRRCAGTQFDPWLIKAFLEMSARDT